MQTATLGRVQSPRIIRIGGGVAAETADVLDQFGLSRPLIVTDPVVAELHLATLTEVLDTGGLAWGLFDQVVEKDALVDTARDLATDTLTATAEHAAAIKALCAR